MIVYLLAYQEQIGSSLDFKKYLHRHISKIKKIMVAKMTP